MRNSDLSVDYVRRAEVRLQALDVLFTGESWADVVGESQEIVELALKGLLRSCGIEPPRIHDVSEILLTEKERLPAPLHTHVERLAQASKDLRRDLELAFYGAEDLTPSSFYSQADAVAARDSARMTVETVKPFVTKAS